MMLDYEEVFNDSFERVKLDDNGNKFFYKFYQNFLGSSQEVRDKFEHTDMDDQVIHLRESFFFSVQFFIHKKAGFSTYRIATSHSLLGYNIRPELYDLWLDSLIKTVRQFDNMYDSDVGLSWKMVTSYIITYMKDMYLRNHEILPQGEHSERIRKRTNNGSA